MNQLTNQELLQELNKRIQTGTLRTQIVADEIHETSSCKVKFDQNPPLTLNP